MPFRFSLAGCHEVDGIWPSVARGLEHACRKSGGDLTADYLWSECRSGRAFLCIVSDGPAICAASVWRFEKWSSGKKLKCLALYGQGMRGWLDGHRAFTVEMAKAGGASSIVTDGRAGWGRLYPEARILRQTYEVDVT